jgi:hypothetical protein
MKIEKDMTHGGYLLKLAQFCEIAYEDEVTCKTMILNKGYEDCTIIESKEKGSFGFICEDISNKKHCMYITIRGSDSKGPNKSIVEMKKDWALNKKCGLAGLKTDVFGTLWVHEGFKESADSLSQQVMRNIQAVNPERIIFNGHSLGAATAKLLSLMFMYTPGAEVAQYGFGEPRSLGHSSKKFINDIFGDSLFSPCHRIWNNNDFVVRIPMRVMGYSHYGKPYLLTEEHELIYDPSLWTIFTDKASGIIKDIFEKGLDGEKDHYIENYIAALKTIAEREQDVFGKNNFSIPEGN